eukprot:scaffold130191_cov14-Prasinocladus_malaysianus.AAC.1
MLPKREGGKGGRKANVVGDENDCFQFMPVVLKNISTMQIQADTLQFCLKLKLNSSATSNRRFCSDLPVGLS